MRYRDRKQPKKVSFRVGDLKHYYTRHRCKLCGYKACVSADCKDELARALRGRMREHGFPTAKEALDYDRSDRRWRAEKD